ncbi:hypothetical protein MC885_002487, partial [Smutsia gigantea]
DRELSVVNNYGLETFWTQKEIVSLCFGLEIPSEEFSAYDVGNLWR